MALININYESKTLGMPVMINAIIPQGRGSYKTLYLLHGMGGDYTTWITKSRVADYVDNTDIAVIMISGDNKCFVDNVHGRKYFTFLTEELIETCTNWFGLSCDRKDRYIAGMSMGGYGAVHAALIKPDVYGKVFSYSGLLDIEKRFDNPQGINTYQIFGDRENLSDNRFDIMNCLKEDNFKTNVENYPEFYIRCGLYDQILPMSRQWNKYASDAGLKVNYYETVQVSTQGDTMLIVSENGMGKRTDIDEYTVQHRGGKGVKCYKITEKTGNVVGAKAVDDSREVMLITTEGIIIRLQCSDISNLGRITSGVKLINLDEGIKVATIAKVRKQPADEDGKDAEGFEEDTDKTVESED